MTVTILAALCSLVVAASARGFVSDSSDCRVSNLGRCVQTRNFGIASYGVSESCRITVTGFSTDIPFVTTHFETELRGDLLSILPGPGEPETWYSGDAAPQGNATSATVFTWDSNTQLNHAGWQLCLVIPATAGHYYDWALGTETPCPEGKTCVDGVPELPGFYLSPPTTDCTLDASQRCAMSYNFGQLAHPAIAGTYRNSQTCGLRLRTIAGHNMQLVTAFFETEATHDPVTVIGVRSYSGRRRSSVPGGAVDRTTRMRWSSDISVTRAGWKMCLSIAVSAGQYFDWTTLNATSCPPAHFCDGLTQPIPCSSSQQCKYCPYPSTLADDYVSCTVPSMGFLVMFSVLGVLGSLVYLQRRRHLPMPWYRTPYPCNIVCSKRKFLLPYLALATMLSAVMIGLFVTFGWNTGMKAHDDELALVDYGFVIMLVSCLCMFCCWAEVRTDHVPFNRAPDAYAFSCCPCSGSGGSGVTRDVMPDRAHIQHIVPRNPERTILLSTPPVFMAITMVGCPALLVWPFALTIVIFEQMDQVEYWRGWFWLTVTIPPALWMVCLLGPWQSYQAHMLSVRTGEWLVLCEAAPAKLEIASADLRNEERESFDSRLEEAQQLVWLCSQGVNCDVETYALLYGQERVAEMAESARLAIEQARDRMLPVIKDLQILAMTQSEEEAFDRSEGISVTVGCEGHMHQILQVSPTASAAVLRVRACFAFGIRDPNTMMLVFAGHALSDEESMEEHAVCDMAFIECVEATEAHLEERRLQSQEEADLTWWAWSARTATAQAHWADPIGQHTTPLPAPDEVEASNVLLAAKGDVAVRMEEPQVGIEVVEAAAAEEVPRGGPGEAAEGGVRVFDGQDGHVGTEQAEEVEIKMDDV